MPKHRFSLVRALPGIGWRAFAATLLWSVMGAQAQSLEQTQREFLHGNYDTVIKNAQKRVDAGDYQDEWRILLVKSLLTTGRYAQAHSNAVAGLADSGGNLELRLLVREADLYQNDSAAARRQLVEMKYLIESRFKAFQSEDGVSLGKALLLLGVEPRLVLDNCFRRAEKASPPSREAFAAVGDLALEKHDFALAADAFRAGLKTFPEDPDLEGGLARAYEPSSRSNMLRAAHIALAANPRHVQTLLLLADHLIDAEEYDEADKELALVLKVNPHQPQALAYRSILATIRNDPDAEAKCRADALKYWKTNPEVDYLIGTKLAHKYRFVEAAAAQRRALDFDPAYIPASRELAEDLLRLGNDEEGWSVAQDARSRDNYDVTLYNLVTLKDAMAKFETVSNADFSVRMTPHEAALYGDRVLALLERAKQTLCAKYGMELTQRTTVEIFPQQKDFAVRTFGMPGIEGFLGVCFGSVITANSPASQEPNPANWEDVLWHEFCHVVTLTATKNRMPRWLSEGISVYEERQADPAWGERMNLDYRDIIVHDKMTPLGDLSSAFLTPKSPQALQFAYYESSLVVEFLVQQYGMDALKGILKQLRDGDEINKAIAAHSAPIPKLQKEFAAFALEKANHLAPGADIETPPGEGESAESDFEDIPNPGPKLNPGRGGGSVAQNLATALDQGWEETHGSNYYVLLRKALPLMEAKDWERAEPVLQQLAHLYHGESRGKNSLWLLSVAQHQLGRTNEELATLEEFVKQESAYVPLFSRLIALHQQKQDWAEVLKYGQKLLAIDPLITTPWDALAKAGVATGQNDAAISAFRKMLLLDPPDPSELHFQLARLLHTRGGSEAEAKRHALEALQEAPRFREAQRLLLDIEAAAPTAPQQGHS
jgi:tetratricopeptide (TPR) repeat protein